MFKITLSPVRGDAPITLEKRGRALIVNGEAFDFAFLSEGDKLPREAVSGDWLGSDVAIVEGVTFLTVIFPHGQNAPHETRFPAAIEVTEDGPIPLPPYDAPEDEA